MRRLIKIIIYVFVALSVVFFFFVNDVDLDYRKRELHVRVVFDDNNIDKIRKKLNKISKKVKSRYDYVTKAEDFKEIKKRTVDF